MLKNVSTVPSPWSSHFGPSSTETVRSNADDEDDDESEDDDDDESDDDDNDDKVIMRR